jgi:hypothetical protein
MTPMQKDLMNQLKSQLFIDYAHVHMSRSYSLHVRDQVFFFYFDPSFLQMKMREEEFVRAGCKINLSSV